MDCNNEELNKLLSKVIVSDKSFDTKITVLQKYIKRVEESRNNMIIIEGADIMDFFTEYFINESAVEKRTIELFETTVVVDTVPVDPKYLWLVYPDGEERRLYDLYTEIVTNK